MRRATRRGLAVAALVLAVAACGDSDDAATTTSTTTAESTTSTTEAASTTTEPAAEPAYVVTLEDPGQEPRRELRLGVEAGDTDQVTQRQEITIEIEAGGQVQSAPSPPTEIDLSYTIEEVDGERISAVGTYDDVRVLEGPDADPALVGQLRQMLDGFRDATAHTTYTPQGAVLEARLEGLELDGAAGPVVEQLAASFTDAVEALSTPFPDEAVGTGARWRIDTETEIAGLPVAITTLVQLTELTDDRATGTVDQTVRFVPGDVDLLGVPATVVSGELTGGGPIEWDLAGGIVPRSDITTSGATIIEANGVEIRQRQQQRISFSSR